MRIVKLKVGETFIHASPLSLFIHRQAFNRNLMIDAGMAFVDGEIVERSLAQKVFWTLAKTANTSLIDYEDWIYLLPENNDWKIIVIQELEDKLYVEEREKEENNVVIDEANWEVSILVNAKRMGLTIEELNLFTMQSFFDYQDMYLGNVETKRKASQEDIDALLM